MRILLANVMEQLMLAGVALACIRRRALLMNRCVAPGGGGEPAAAGSGGGEPGVPAEEGAVPEGPGATQRRPEEAGPGPGGGAAGPRPAGPGTPSRPQRDGWTLTGRKDRGYIDRWVG